MCKKRLTLAKDQNKVKKIIEAIYKNDGFCPCRLTKSEDTKCPCKEMLENQECHCGLFE